MDIIQIIGYGLYVILLIMAIIWILGVRLKSVVYPTVLSSLYFTITFIVFSFIEINKIHLIWVIPLLYISAFINIIIIQIPILSILLKFICDIYAGIIRMKFGLLLIIIISFFLIMNFIDINVFNHQKDNQEDIIKDVELNESEVINSNRNDNSGSDINSSEVKVVVNSVGDNYSLKIPSNYPSECSWTFMEGVGAVQYHDETKSDVDNIHIVENRVLSEQAFGYEVRCFDSSGLEYVGQFTDENLDYEISKKTEEYRADAFSLELNTNLKQDLFYLRNLDGKYTHDYKFFNNPIIRNRLIKLMGDDFAILETYWGVTSPIVVKNDIFSASACMAHNCSNTSFLIVIDISKNVFYVISKVDEYKKYYYEEKNDIPSEVSDWDKKN